MDNSDFRNNIQQIEGNQVQSNNSIEPSTSDPAKKEPVIKELEYLWTRVHNAALTIAVSLNGQDWNEISSILTKLDRFAKPGMFTPQSCEFQHKKILATIGRQNQPIFEGESPLEISKRILVEQCRQLATNPEINPLEEVDYLYSIMDLDRLEDKSNDMKVEEINSIALDTMYDDEGQNSDSEITIEMRKVRLQIQRDNLRNGSGAPEGSISEGSLGRAIEENNVIRSPIINNPGVSSRNVRDGSFGVKSDGEELPSVIFGTQEVMHITHISNESAQVIGNHDLNDDDIHMDINIDNHIESLPEIPLDDLGSVLNELENCNNLDLHHEQNQCYQNITYDQPNLQHEKDLPLIEINDATPSSGQVIEKDSIQIEIQTKDSNLYSDSDTINPVLPLAIVPESNISNAESAPVIESNAESVSTIEGNDQTPPFLEINNESASNNEKSASQSKANVEADKVNADINSEITNIDTPISSDNEISNSNINSISDITAININTSCSLNMNKRLVVELIDFNKINNEIEKTPNSSRRQSTASRRSSANSNNEDSKIVEPNSSIETPIVANDEKTTPSPSRRDKKTGKFQRTKSKSPKQATNRSSSPEKDKNSSPTRSPSRNDKSILSRLTETRLLKQRRRASENANSTDTDSDQPNNSNAATVNMNLTNATRKEKVQSQSNTESRLGSNIAKNQVTNTKNSSNFSNNNSGFRKQMKLIHDRITMHRYGNVFRTPVRESNAPGYYNAVKSPSDMKSVKRLIESGSISTITEYESAMGLMFLNALVYNPANNEIHDSARTMALDSFKIIDEFKYTQKLLIAKQLEMENEESEDIQETNPQRTEEEYKPPSNTKTNKLLQKRKSSSFSTDEPANKLCVVSTSTVVSNIRHDKTKTGNAQEDLDGIESDAPSRVSSKPVKSNKSKSHPRRNSNDNHGTNSDSQSESRAGTATKEAQKRQLKLKVDLPGPIKQGARRRSSKDSSANQGDIEMSTPATSNSKKPDVKSRSVKSRRK